MNKVFRFICIWLLSMAIYGVGYAQNTTSLGTFKEALFKTFLSSDVEGILNPEQIILTQMRMPICGWDNDFKPEQSILFYNKGRKIPFYSPNELCILEVQLSSCKEAVRYLDYFSRSDVLDHGDIMKSGGILFHKANCVYVVFHTRPTTVTAQMRSRLELLRRMSDSQPIAVHHAQPCKDWKRCFHFKY